MRPLNFEDYRLAPGTAVVGTVGDAPVTGGLIRTEDSYLYGMTEDQRSEAVQAVWDLVQHPTARFWVGEFRRIMVDKEKPEEAPQEVWIYDIVQDEYLPLKGEDVVKSEEVNNYYVFV